MWIDLLIRIGIIAAAALGSYFLARYLLVSYLPGRFIQKKNMGWVKFAVKRRLHFWIAVLAPVLVVSVLTQLLLDLAPEFSQLVSKITTILGLTISLLIINALINTALDIYETFPLARQVPLTGLGQVVKAVVFVVIGFLAVAVLLEVPTSLAFGTLAALLAAAGFVFHDPILNFVAGLQLAANKMVIIGDWIEMPEYGADGAVLEVNITAAKVQNWDNTITTIPTNHLVTRAFKNWRGMQESGGRRIKRAIHLDMRSIRTATPEMLAVIERGETVQSYLADKGDLDQGIPPALNAPSTLTSPSNLGLFCAVMTDYLLNHPLVRQDLTLLVRQLAPEDDGLPVELLFFTAATDFTPYEAVQFSIMEYALLMLPRFGLVAYQRTAAEPWVKS